MTKKTINNKEELNNEKYNEKQRSKIICSYICCIYSVNDAVCNNNTSNDIEKATDIIKKMIVEYGMNDEFGLLNLDNLDVKPEVITKEAVKLAKALQEQSLILMKENIDRLRDIAEELMKKETLTGEEIRKIAER